MDEYVYDRYATNIKGLKKTLDKYGVAILPKVLNEDECDGMVSAMWDYFEHISSSWETPISRDDKYSWKSIYKLFPIHGMLFQHFNCGQSQACWDLRQNPKIVEIFAHLWKCKKEELLVSYDGFSFGLPPEDTGRGWGKTWYHTDQSYTRNDFECIQSWVTGLDVNKGDATLGIMEGSHKLHEAFRKKFKVINKSDWYKLDSNEEKFYKDAGCKYQRIACPKGSLVFWDSRTIHCGVNPVKGRDSADIRSVVYLCYQPRSMISEKELKKKLKAFEEMRMTTHYPTKIKLFAMYPRTYGEPMPVITHIARPKLTELGKRLAGL